MRNLLILLVLFIYFPVTAQVGTIVNTDDSTESYTLFSSIFNKGSYLVDNCGHLINSWMDGPDNGLSSRLLSDGRLLRGVKKTNCCIYQPSTGGGFEIRSWTDELLWAYDENSETFVSHHDFVDLPNGNILLLGWEILTAEEQLALGKDPDNIFPEFWGEYVKEIKPIGTDEVEIIWEWHLKDHFIQNINPDSSNYKDVSTNIGKMDVNYQSNLLFSEIDNYHVNAIDYNPERDEILLNARSVGELWIIDHSTTTEQAATDEGGNRGQGGDFIFRYGNPEAYQNGEWEDHVLYGSHGSNWVDESYPEAGSIIIFNNGVSRPAGEFATVDRIDPIIDDNGDYVLDSDGNYGVNSHEVLFGADENIVSSYVSNAHSLSNGNIMINAGDLGELFEIDENQNTLWHYRIPLAQNFPVSQNSSSNQYLVFKAYKYELDDPILDGVDLSPGPVIETDSTYNVCTLVDIDDHQFEKQLSIVDFQDQLNIQYQGQQKVSIAIYRVDGQQKFFVKEMGQAQIIQKSQFETGLYYLVLSNSQGQHSTKVFTVF